jgi:type IV secretory pathway VirB6-like protein
VNQTHFFAAVFNALITPNLAAMQAMIADVAAQMQPIALVMVVVWLCFAGADMAAGSKSGPQVIKEFAIAALFLGLLPMAQYSTYVSGFFLNAVPNTVGAAMGGQGSPVAALDNLLSQAVVASLKTYEALPGNPLKFIPLGLAVIAFLGIAFLTSAFVFGVYMVAALLNVATIVVGPVFITLAAIPLTRRLASGWLGVVVGGCVTQLMALVVIRLLSAGEATMIQGLVVTVAGSDSNSLAMLIGLAEVGALFYLAKLVTQEIPHLARAIGGGVHGAAAAGIHAVTIGAAEKAAAIAATAAAGAAAGAAGGGGVSGAAAGAGRAVMARQFGPAALRSAVPSGPSKS